MGKGKKMFLNKRGISIIGTVLALIILGVMGASLVALVAADQESRMKTLFREKSFYAVQAGLEWALREIKEGGYPIQQNKTLDDANFTVAIDSSQKKITVTGASADASRVNSITTDRLASDCVQINTGGAAVSGAGSTKLTGVSVTKNCLNAINIDKMSVTVSSASNEMIKKITIGGVVVYDDATGTPSGQTIDITDSRITSSANIDSIDFNTGVSGKKFIITLTFTDTSQYASSQFKP